MSKPTFILVHGAWHRPDCFDRVTAGLHSKGYTTDCVTLPSVNAPTPLVDGQPDYDAVHAAVSAAVSRGEEVVLVMHSYGGIAGSGGLQGIDPKHVRRVIYLCAFAVDEGVSLVDATGGKGLTPWQEFDATKNGILVKDTTNIFYNDLSPTDAQFWSSRLDPGNPDRSYQSRNSFGAPLPFAPHRHGFSCAYVMCTMDNAIPLALQEAMVAAAQEKVKGAFEMVERLESSHSPFLSMPDRLVEVLLGML